MKTKQENIFSSKTLTYFLQLADTMNYTQAAQLLGITQPALTQQIKKLERTVGAPLFYSIGKKLHLSDAGRTMLQTTYEIYELLNQATDEIQQSTSATKGTISIGFLSSMEDKVMMDFIVHYFNVNPDVQISLLMLTRKEIWERLENNQIDLAVMYLPDDNIKNWKPYKSKKIIDDTLLFLHHNEKMSRKRKIKFKDTLDSPWVSYPELYYLNQFVKEAFKNQKLDTPTTVAQFTTPMQILQFAQATNTYAALPSSFIQAHANETNLLATGFDPSVHFELAFVYRKEKEQIPRIDNFLEEFTLYLNNEDYLSRLKNNISEKGDNKE